MPIDITMPSLGESVIEATVSRWLKRVGEPVNAHEPLLEVATDKVDTEIPAPVDGTLLELLADEGATVMVGAVIARLADAADASGASPPAEQPTRRVASPVAQRLAEANALDLAAVAGTGLGGRVMKRDVEEALANETRDTRHETRKSAQPTAQNEAQSASDTQTLPDNEILALHASRLNPQSSALGLHPSSFNLQPLSPMRRSIAQHMLRSVQTAPHATTVMEADLSRVVAHRDAHAQEYRAAGLRLTFTPYFVWAAAQALRRSPLVNASFGEAGITMHREVHIGVAVALPEGLLVPVIRNADELALRGLARAVVDVAERARAGKLQPGETQGGTFTVTNHGGSGSLLATPIINQPQAAILGVGAVQKRVVVLSDDRGDTLAILPDVLPVAFVRPPPARRRPGRRFPRNG